MDRTAYRRKRQQEEAAKKRAQEHRELARFYNLNSMLENDGANFYIIIGARGAGKSYAEAIVDQKYPPTKRKLANG